MNQQAFHTITGPLSRAESHKPNKNQGLTLIELVVTVALLSIIVMVAIPSFQQLIESNRITSQANNLLSAINLARSESVKRGMPVSVKAIDNDFSNGWCVCRGAADDDCDEGDRLIRHFDGNDQISVVASASAIEFNGRGERSVPGPGAGVLIQMRAKDCKSGEVNKQRNLIIGSAGRSSASRVDCS